VLDTVPGMSGYGLYRRAGWTKGGIIPDYALFPDERLCDTAVFWKRLDRPLKPPSRRRADPLPNRVSPAYG
jgi:hypothetical protein